MNNLLIIRGAPGVGKSSVSKLLSAHYKNGVTIEIDEVRRMINSVTWTNSKEHLNAIEATRCLLVSYATSNYDPVIVVDTLSMGTIKLILDRLPEEINCKVISLIAKEKIIKARILNRNSGFKDYELSFKVNSSISNEKLKNNYIIDTSDLDVGMVFHKAIKIMGL